MSAKFRLPLLAALGLLATAPLFARDAAAQHPCPGQITSTALRPLPPGATYNVAGQANNPDEVRLRDAVLAGLRRSNHPIADQPTLLLAWRGGVSMEGGGGSGAYFPDRDSFRDSDDLQWAQEVPRYSRPSAPVVRLNGRVDLRDRASGQVIWTAIISCTRQGSDQNALFSTLVAAVLPILGQTVAGRQF